MLHRVVRAGERWSSLLVAGAVSLAMYRTLGWKWAPAVILAVLTGVAAWIAWLRARSAVIGWFDRRRGLAVREWSAVRALGNCTEHPDQGLFDSFSLSSTRRTEDAVPIGYATILAHLLITARLGPDPSDRALEHLAADCGRRWRAVVRQKPARLVMLLGEARDYERDGFPHADWDNFRAMAAAAGALCTSRTRPQRMRHEVADRYHDHIGRQAASGHRDRGRGARKVV